MSGLKNTFRRTMSAVTGKGYSTKEERAAKKAATEQTALDRLYASAAIPDAETIRRNERRKAARRRGSRVRNVLTDRQRLGG